MMHNFEIWMSALLGLAMIGLLVWLIVRSISPPPSSRSGDDTNAAIEILRRRFAAGDIGEHSLEEIRELLETSSAQEKYHVS